MQKDRVTIVCISPYLGVNGEALHIARTYNNFTLPACQNNQKYRTLVIEDQTDYKRIESGDLITPPEFVPITINAMDIANDLMKAGNLKNEGGIICAGEDPTEAELDKAHDNRRAWLVASVQKGDAIFGKMGPRGIEHIPDYCKRAVAELKVTRDWVFQPEGRRVEPERCEGCAAPITFLTDGSKPAICAGCGAPLDMEKAIRLGLFKPAAVEEDLVEVGKGKQRKQA